MHIESKTARFVGVDFSNMDCTRAIACVVAAAAVPRLTTVVTPNVDHIVRMDRLGTSAVGRQYRAALADSDYCLCDSRVLSRLARWRGLDLPVVPGSDLTAAIFAHHLDPGDLIAIVGGTADTIPDLNRAYPVLRFVQHVPPMGMIDDDHAMDDAARFIAASGARFVFVAVGSPQGEILVHRARLCGATHGVALSIGASIDFLTGRQSRAPRFVRKLGFEWAYRLLNDPKRLWRRYLVDGPRIFAIVWRSPTDERSRHGS